MRKAIGIGLVGLVVLGARAACNSPNGVQVTVDITAPADVPIEQLTMSAVDAAFTTLTAASSGDDDNQLKWTFAGFVFPSSGNSGTSVAVKTPAAWPADNSFWGEKDVELEYDGGVAGATGDCEAKVGVKVFFESTADAHNTHAWYFYFKQEAVYPLNDFTPLKGDNPIWDTTHFGNDANGFYSVDAYYYYPIQRLRVDQATLYINTSHYEGINEVARIVAHEYTHQRLCQNREDEIKAIIANENDLLKRAIQLQAVDVDEDWVADSEDPNIGAASHEALAVAWAASHINSMIDDKDADWSKGGHNYVQ